MKTVKILKITASTLVLGMGVMGAGPAGLSTIALASDEAQARSAESTYGKALRALKKQKFDDAAALAETAVAFAPNRADYRMVLGQAYLGLGRLSSAEQAFGDVVALDPSHARAGLNRALMQIALGRGESALETLDRHREGLSAADFGLAVALAGDTSGAVKVLENAVRATGADVKTRQNLALAYALNGQWAQSRITASIDVSPDQLDLRMMEWAQFSRPVSASDQVASLMQIRPANDPGQPERLALVRQTQQVAAVVAPAPVELEPALAVAADPAPSFEVADPAPAVAVAPAAPVITIPLDDPIPASAPVSPPVAPAPVKQAVVAVKPAQPSVPRFTRPVESGRFVVQLGAFSNEGRAQIAWSRAAGRTRQLEDFGASTARVQVKGASLYRLSVSGFATRLDAARVCTRVKASGGECFVRSIAGDTPMQWVSRGGTRLASRR